MSIRRVVLDANILLPPTLSDLILRLCEEPALLQPHWSVEILDEVMRNQRRKGWDEQVALRWREAVENAFPEAVVEHYSRQLLVCSNDVKDRHVLAVAIKAGVDTIVTDNLRDFPLKALTPHRIKAISANDCLTQLANENPELMLQKLAEAASDRRRSLAALIRHFQIYLPKFSAVVSAYKI